MHMNMLACHFCCEPGLMMPGACQGFCALLVLLVLCACTTPSRDPVMPTAHDRQAAAHAVVD
jgi:hypothetical protein